MKLIEILGSSFMLEGWTYPRTLIRLYCGTTTRGQPSEYVINLVWGMARAAKQERKYDINH